MNDRRFISLPVTRGTASLIVLSVLGLAVIVYRFLFGLGAVTNLSDGYPWGLWIAIDVLVGIALAAGGFVMAGLVYILGQKRFEPLARPAIFTALLGYLLFVFALAVDLGRPWHIWSALISWNHASPMFEVSWCVMFYTFVLILEFAPAFFERFRLDRLYRIWRQAVPITIIGVLTLFAYAMTDSIVSAVATAAMLLGWEVLMRMGVIPRNKQVPLLLIFAGVILSTLHQSSLGTLFLITDKLSTVWYSPILPLLFLLSAVMVAPAMVIIESLVSGRVLGRRPELHLLVRLGRGMPYLIGAYLFVRLADAFVRGIASDLVALSLESAWWWLEIGVLLIALARFATPEVRVRSADLLAPALATVAAVAIHRVGVAIIGIEVPGYAAYIPAWSEIAVSAGIVAIGLLAFRVAVQVLPVYAREPGRREVCDKPPPYIKRPAA